MTPIQLKKWRQHFGWTQQDLGDAIGVSRVSIAYWEMGRYPIPRWVKIYLMHIAARRGEVSRVKKADKRKLDKAYGLMSEVLGYDITDDEEAEDEDEDEDE